MTRRFANNSQKSHRRSARSGIIGLAAIGAGPTSPKANRTDQLRWASPSLLPNLLHEWEHSYEQPNR